MSKIWRFLGSQQLAEYVSHRKEMTWFVLLNCFGLLWFVALRGDKDTWTKVMAAAENLAWIIGGGYITAATVQHISGKRAEKPAQPSQLDGGAL